MPDPIDPRAPVLIGCGQVRQRVEDPRDGEEPLGLMEAAARAAEADTGAAGVLAQLDAIHVPRGLWPYDNPAAWLRDRLGATSAVTGLAPISGSMIQYMISASAREIVDGRRDLVIVVGAEAEHSKRRARRSGVALPWTELPESEPDVRFGDPDTGEDGMVSGHEIDRGLGRPATFFSLYENALRHARGESLEAHRVRISELWAGFSRVAAGNPYAWSQEPVEARTVREFGPDNRLAAWPYPKRMCSNMVVDLGAAVIVCAAEVAERLGVARERWVFLHASTDATHAALLSHRNDFVSEPAIRLAGRRALELAEATIGEIEFLDLYSCFPAAVQLAVQELAIPEGRPLSVTGGLGFAGGPFNSYVLHSTATMMNRLRERRGARGLVTSVGGWVSKHAFGIYGTEPPVAGYRYEDVSPKLALLPARRLRDDPPGRATVETYALAYREGNAAQLTAACLDADGVRCWATSDDPRLMERVTQEELIGRSVGVGEGGRLALM